MEFKTNVMRIFDKSKLTYLSHSYDSEEAISGQEVAKVLNIDPSIVFKTLVTVSATNQNYVFMIPVLKELDLKKAAKSVGEKDLKMIKQKDLLPLTGYIHGGCSPVGMKKTFKTVIDNSAKQLTTIVFSAGRIGYQIEMSLTELAKVLKFELEDIAIENN